MGGWSLFLILYLFIYMFVYFLFLLYSVFMVILVS